MSGTAVVVAFGAGFVSFLAPCVLPLVPGYLGRLLRPGRRLLQQGDRLLRLVLLSRADRHRDRRALAVADQVQLGAEAALAAPQGVVLRLTGRRIFFSPPRPPTGAPG